MKKISITSLISFIFLFISSLTCYFLRYANLNAIQLICTSLGVLFVDGIFYVLSHKNFIANNLCLLICSIALGFGIRSWYVYRNLDNNLLTMTLVTLCSVLHLFIFFLLTKIPYFKDNKKPFLIGYILLSIVIYTIIVFQTSTTYISTFGYYMIAQLAFAYASIHETNDYKSLIMNVTKYSFFSVLAILIIILVIISEGDFDFDFDLPTFEKSKKKKR